MARAFNWEDSDPLAPSRGCLAGLIVGILLWVFFALLFTAVWWMSR